MINDNKDGSTSFSLVSQKHVLNRISTALGELRSNYQEVETLGLLNRRMFKSSIETSTKSSS